MEASQRECVKIDDARVSIAFAQIPDGKPANKFGYDNECKGKAFTLDVIKETHEAYVHLKSGARPNSEELSLI